MRSHRLIVVAASAICGLQGTARASGPPTLSSLNTALTILRHNDLRAQYSQNTAAAILIENPKSSGGAKATCNSLYEQLWSPDTHTQQFSLGLDTSLAYQIYLGKFPQQQLFWIAPDPQDRRRRCRAISKSGAVQFKPCGSKLPALCTHSAPIANKDFVDTSTRYQIKVKSRKQHVTGFRDSAGFRFDGIRFAPTPERFQHSTVLDASGSSSALAFGNGCLQTEYGSEDCLFLNIATPYLPVSPKPHHGGSAGQPEQHLKPVMFYIYGGGFVQNSGNLGNYDGVNLAGRGDVVVVKINYRLGLFGFLALTTADGSLNGNYGFGDMLTALKWVRQNIAAFGGDPDRITVFGDSAGALSTAALMSSQKAQGLFSAAIIQSLPIGSGTPGETAMFWTVQQATDIFTPILASTGCLTAPNPKLCLKATSATDLLAAQDILGPMNLVADGYFVSVTTLPVSGGSYIAPVPLIIGVNRDENAIAVSLTFPSFTGDPTSLVDWLTWAETVPFFDDLGNGRTLTDFASHPAFPHPPGSPESVGFNITQRIVTDTLFRCGSWSAAYLAAKYRTLPQVYVYEMNRTYQPGRWTVPECEAQNGPDGEYYKCHSGEVDLIFGSLLWIGEEPRDQFDIPYSQLLVDHWSSFAWSHDPNPSSQYLQARGYSSTLSQLTKWGKWEKLRAHRPTMRVLQWDGYQTRLSEKEQCNALGLPLNYLRPYT